MFALLASTALFKTMKHFGILRISLEDEMQGLDYVDLGLTSTHPPSELVVDISGKLGSDPEQILARSVGS